jgi:hypothetical protein
VQRCDLTLAVRVLTEAAHKPVYNQTRMICSLAKRHEVTIGLHVLKAARKVQNCLLLHLTKDGTSSEPVQERLEIWLFEGVHTGLPISKREHFVSLSHRSLRALIGDGSV